MKLLSPPGGEHHGSGDGHLAGGLHGGDVEIGLALDFDLAAEAIGGFVGEFVEALDGVEEGEHHEIGRPLLMDEDAEVEIALGGNLAGIVEAADAHVDGDDGGGGAEVAHDGAVAVLAEGADDFGGVADFVGLVGGGESGDDFALGHGDVGWAEIEERVAEGKDVGAVVIGDGTHAGDAHVAGDEGEGDGIAGEEGVLPTGGGLGFAQRAGSAAGDGGDHA